MLSINLPSHSTFDASVCLANTITLQPLTMRIFNNQGIYFPSKIKPQKVITYQEFLEQYADHPLKMRVCFDEPPSSKTMVQHAKTVTAFGVGLDCPHMIISFSST